MPNYLPCRTECLDGFSLCGLSVPITKSQSANAEICSQFWKVFNQKLAANTLVQGKHWQKYAITHNDNRDYRYFCGVPVPIVIPDDFQIVEVASCHCLVFEHHGSIRGITETIAKIYRNFLPNSEYEHERSHFCHFEKYDHRFLWNQANSLVEIWLPITNVK